MACRISTVPDDVKPLAWEPYQSGNRSTSVSLAGQRHFAQVPQQPTISEVSALQRRIQELEQARLPEILRSRQEGIAEGLKQGRAEIAPQINAMNERLAITFADLFSTR